ncbi:MAG: hypothetical protein WC375_09040 [Methanomassiliicoccales archaeon]|jgi:hypothetical protein
MFYFSSFEGKMVDMDRLVVLRFHNSPYSIGCHKDIDGREWDVHAIIGKIIYAKQRNEMGDYYSTTNDSGHGYRSMTWQAYEVEIVEKMELIPA